MDPNLDYQENFNHHTAVAKALSHDVQSEVFYGTIRALLTTIQISRRRNYKLTEPPDLLPITEALIRNTKLTIDLAIVAGKINCLTKVFIQNNPVTVEHLTIQSSQIIETIPKICFLFGIIDCLPCDRYDGMVVVIGEEIFRLLQNFNSVYFHKMKLLLSWLQYVQSIVCFIPLSNPIRTDFLLPQSEMMKLINLHWETTQVQNLPEQCLATICGIWRTAKPTSQYADIVAKMALTNLTWRSRTKYLILATVLPFTHFKEILCEYPDTVYAITTSLDSNCLLAAGTALFKAFTKNLLPDEWEDYCQSVLLDALNHTNRSTQFNAAHYWLPCLTHASPVVLIELKHRLLKAENFNWLAYISLLKLMDHLDESDRLLTQQALIHGEEEVRAAAFGMLLHTNKKTEIIRIKDWNLVNNFLLKNLRSDNPQFRLKLLSTTRLFLIRVLESCLNRMKTNCSIDEDIDNLRKLHDHLLKCLTPLSSYQKKITLLAALRYIHQLFGDNDVQADSLAKGASLTRRRQLIQLAGDRWNFTGKESLDRYTICLMDEVIDVRQKAIDMLRDFFPSPPLDYVQLLYRQGLEMCDSAKFQRSECGASVIQMVSHWSLTSTSTVPELTLEFLMEEIQKRFHQLKLDWMSGASERPVHGFIGALVKFLQLPHPSRSMTSYAALIDLSKTISSYMLDTLASKSTGSPDMAPSFEEMSQAIDDIVRRSNAVETNDTISISVQQQLVLACAWLNLKESGNLAVQVAILLLNDEGLTKEDRVRQVEECAQIVYQILLRCRHKGAIEAAGDAMGLLCRRLFASREETIKAIPGNILTNFLDRLENSKLGASITRRSAGLAFLVSKVVSSQSEKSSTDSLLVMTTKRLITVAQRPFDVNEKQDDICDLPQSVAMHLLKSLVHDASLSVGVQPELMEPIVKLSVDSFSHPHWSVRNAALQLHGAVIPRLIGATGKTTAELFHKLPGLEPFFLQKLAEQPEGRQLVSGGLIPSLSILSRLFPDYGNESRNSRFTTLLIVLLGHPVIQVRQLAAQSLLAFVSLFKTKWITMQLCEDAVTLVTRTHSETPLHMCVPGSSITNSLHGCLFSIYEFLNRCRDVALSVEDWEMIREAVSALIPVENNHPSYYIKSAILKLFQMLPNMAGDLDFFTMYRDKSVRKLYQNQPGFCDWLKLKTELIVNQISLNCMLPAIEHFLPPYSGVDVLETALKGMKTRLARLSSSSVLANTVTGFVTYYITNWRLYPSLLPVCLDFVQARGAGALLESDTSLQNHLDFFLDKCIQARQLGSPVALLAIQTTSSIIKEIIEKGLPINDLEEVTFRLSRCLLEASQPEESTSFRSAAAVSLKTTGKLLVEMANKRAETSQNFFLLILNLIQDEEKDIRTDTAFFLTELITSVNGNSEESIGLVQMSPTQCLEEFAFHIHHWFPKQHVVPVIFNLLKNSDPVKGESIQPLYDREPRNFFHEETESVSFLVKVFETLFAKGDSESWQLDIDVQQVIEEANSLLDRIKADTLFDEQAKEWLFTQSAGTYSALIRLSARLNIIASTCPSWKTDQLELQSTIEILTRQCVL